MAGLHHASGCNQLDVSGWLARSMLVVVGRFVQDTDTWESAGCRHAGLSGWLALWFALWVTLCWWL